jgi:hypothetical protein
VDREKKLNIIEEQYFKIFIRKSVKKPIMTNPYSATYLTAFNYFKQAVEETFKTKIEFGSNEELAFKRFYEFISKEVEDNFFLKNNSKNIIDYIKNLVKESDPQIIIESHDSKTNFVYYKLNSKSFDLIITIPTQMIKKRITKKYETIDKLKIDYDKIAISIRANWVHYIDGLLVRDIIRDSNKVFISIHDCFIVDPFSISEFIILANRQSNIKIFENME